MKKDRLVVIAVILLLMAIALIIRLFELQVIHHEFYLDKAHTQRRMVIPLSVDRGDILDRNGRILATSLDHYSIYVNPREFTSFEALSKILGGKVGPFDKQRMFAWVVRKIDRALAKKVEKAKLKGVYQLVEKKRIYPKSHLASQIIGFVGMDNEGLSGLELAYDKYLKGKEGMIISERDPMGYELRVARDKEIEQASPGMALTLTIDETVQYIAERELTRTLKQFKAVKGMIIVMDIKSGEILALAGKPDFDPNDYRKSDSKSWRSMAADVYEPGSTFKVITVAAGLDEGVIDLNTKLKALNSIELGGKVIENSHKIEWDGPYVTISKMLEQSINTAAVQIAQKLGRERFYKKIRDFGFGERTALELPGESRGIVKHPDYWYKPDIGMMSFGQTIAVTPVQLLSAIATIVNGGIKLEPILVKKIESPDGSFLRTNAANSVDRVLTARAAEDTKKLMENVVTHGTGRRTKMARYRTGGKTGTAQKIAPSGRGYLKDRYIASYVGYAPCDDPRLAVLVIIDDPKGSIWGESVAGPTFKVVMEESLRYLNVPPDIMYNTASKP